MKKLDLWESDDKLALLAGWRLQGWSDRKIAENIGISVRTLSNWQKNSEKINSVLGGTNNQSDILVENALLKKALGYTATEVRTVIKPDGKEEITTVKKEVPPDTSAASLWLKNRCPDKWREKPTDEDNSLRRVEELLGGIDAIADK